MHLKNNMEQFSQQSDILENAPKEPFQNEDTLVKKDEEEKTGKLSKFVKRHLGLTATVGLGYLGGMQENAASGQETMEKAPIVSEKSAESIQDDSSERDGNLFQILHKDQAFSWGVEYIPKKHDGRNILAQRFVKIDAKTNKTTVLGEYDNLFQASEGLSKIKDLPESILRLARADLGKIETERNFQASGLVEQSGDVAGKTHVEKRSFKGFGIETKNQVEVDEKGNVVKLVSSEIGGK